MCIALGGRRNQRWFNAWADVWVTCKSHTSLYKGLEHLQIFVFEVGPGTNSPRDLEGQLYWAEQNSQV